MSENSTEVTAEHFRYLAERTVRDDDFLRRLKRAAEQEGIRPIWIAPEQASFMQILLGMLRAREVLEIGTLVGYSAIVMARALPADGTVRTIEIDEHHARFAREWIARSDVAGKIEVLVGSGQEWLPRLGAGSVDALFIDADKESYPLYLEHGLRVVRPGGAIMVDNAFAFGRLFSDDGDDPEVSAMRRFNDLLAAHPGLHSVIVPLGDGLWVAVKKA